MELTTKSYSRGLRVAGLSPVSRLCKTAVVLGLAIFATALIGCHSVRDETLTEQTADAVMQKVRTSNDVTPEEAALVAAYLLRHGLEEAGAENAAILPVTVDVAIARQREAAARFAEQQRLEEERQQRALAESRARAEANRRRQIELRSLCPVSIVSMRHLPIDVWRSRYREQLTMTVRVENHSGKAIRATQGRIVFFDSLNNELGHRILTIDRDIADGAFAEIGTSGEYNDFRAMDRAVRSYDPTRGHTEWFPTKVVYVDGTSVEVADE